MEEYIDAELNPENDFDLDKREKYIDVCNAFHKQICLADLKMNEIFFAFAINFSNIAVAMAKENNIVDSIPQFRSTLHNLLDEAINESERLFLGNTTKFQE